MDAVRPYAAAFTSRFLLMLQYRAAALAGFATQCWWGGIKVMIYSAFFAAAPAAAAGAPMSLAQVITYTWLAQALLALTPWSADPEIALAVRTGGVAYDRLRPLDTYALWYVRGAAWMASRAVPRAALMLLAAGFVLPLIGLSDWAWKPPATFAAAALFAVALPLALALSAAFLMIVNVVVAATLTDRGPNVLFNALIIVFSGNLLPLALYPDWARTALLVQPFAGMLDIPLRLYVGELSGAAAAGGLALQAFWTLTLIALGRWALSRVMRRLEVQGG
ncbi:MAG: ABC transporter permease [Phenylobacterium sp.]|uniref:ABC transporter permease n=1 Tax=Phenylobacterium sp. TaxID=1871053 RepID=UPI003919B5BF